MVLKLFLMVILGAIGIWVAIPIGLAMKLNPVIVSLSTTIGAILCVILILSVGKPLRRWYVKRYHKKEEKARTKLIQKIWQRYGTIGYGLLAPLVIGAHIGAVLGLMLGVPTRNLLLWLSIGTFIWCVVFTILGTLGLAGVKSLV